MNSYLLDDIVTFPKLFDKSNFNLFQNYNVFVIGTHEIVEIIELYFDSFRKLEKKNTKQYVTVHNIVELKNIYPNRDLRKPSMFFLIVDYQTIDIKQISSYVKEIKKQIDEIKTYVKSSKKNLFQLTSLIPEVLTEQKEKFISLAENEYYFYYRNKNNSLHSYVIQIEDYLTTNYTITNQIQCVRVDRLYGPGVKNDLLGISNLCTSVVNDKKIILGQEDEVTSCIYIQKAIACIFLCLLSGRKGNVYHITDDIISKKDILLCLYQLFGDKYKLKIIDEETYNQKCEKHILNGYKLLLILGGKKSNKVLESTINKTMENTFCFINNIEEQKVSVLDVYYGRMNRIRELELSILNDFDRICRKHDIKYFLTAGTMLGAVRHNGFIPWDDDVDVGMLPEEYKKLQKVITKELNPKYGYQNCFFEKQSHYIHDKIRYLNTYFSTNYSNKYKMMNGVYIDIFLYYKTSNIPLFQKIHIKEIALWRRLIGIRWSTKLPSRIIGKVLFLLVKLLPPAFYDFIYRCICMRYQHLKTNYRIDGGFNLEKVKAVPNDWFIETMPYNFEGNVYPILKKYDSFLTHWYSSKYMSLPPLSMRSSVHDVKRIDLGQFLCNDDINDIEPLDIKGELY